MKKIGFGIFIVVSMLIGYLIYGAVGGVGTARVFNKVELICKPSGDKTVDRLCEQSLDKPTQENIQLYLDAAKSMLVKSTSQLKK